MGRRIRRLTYNWTYSPENGEEYGVAEIGVGGVTEITEHEAKGDGDRWFYDVHLLNGDVERVFNPNLVYFKAGEQ